MVFDDNIKVSETGWNDLEFETLPFNQIFHNMFAQKVKSVIIASWFWDQRQNNGFCTNTNEMTEMNAAVSDTKGTEHKILKWVTRGYEFDGAKTLVNGRLRK